MKPLSEKDLLHVLEHTQNVWDELSESRLLITGGTGFFGKWLLESICFSINKHRLKTKIYVLTRNKKQFELEYPHIASHKSIHFIEGDIQTINIKNEIYTHVIHAASDGSKIFQEMYSSIVQGTQNLLEICSQCKTSKMLFTSSGAIYGKQPSNIKNIPEIYNGAPNPLDIGSTYGQSKRIAEHLCSIYAQQSKFEIKIARCFAFIGPHIPLNISLAAGNFIRDGLNGSPILVKGDGSAIRSYLYAADLSIWLLKILIEGNNQTAYNVGSENEISIANLAQHISNNFNPPLPVIISKNPITGNSPERYIPSTSLAQKELNLQEWIPLNDAIYRTIKYYQS